MNISTRKITAIAKFKSRELMKNKTFTLVLILVLGMVAGMRYLYAQMGLEDMPEMIFGMVLSMGVLFNLTMIAMMMPATLLAKDKERHTLRTLMTSSVNAIEYFLGSIIPLILVSIFLNLAVLIISGINLSLVNLPVYFLITTIGVITSCIIGMIVGIYAKNQMSTSNIITPIMLVLLIIPLFGNMVENLKEISQFLYTGVISKMIETYSTGQSYQLDVMSISVMIGEIFLAIVLFVISYRRNGFEKD